MLDQIRQFGHARRGWLGVNIQSVTDEIAESLGLDKPAGALIASVHDGGPAQVAGIQPGDVVLTFDGKTIDRYAPICRASSPRRRSTRRSRSTVWRKRKEVDLDVKVGELKEDDQQAANPPSRTAGRAGRYGEGVRPVARQSHARAPRALWLADESPASW